MKFSNWITSQKYYLPKIVKPFIGKFSFLVRFCVLVVQNAPKGYLVETEGGNADPAQSSYSESFSSLEAVGDFDMGYSAEEESWQEVKQMMKNSKKKKIQRNRNPCCAPPEVYPGRGEPWTGGDSSFPSSIVHWEVGNMPQRPPFWFFGSFGFPEFQYLSGMFPFQFKTYLDIPFWSEFIPVQLFSQC